MQIPRFNMFSDVKRTYLCGNALQSSHGRPQSVRISRFNVLKPFWHGMRKALEYGYGVSGQNADHIDPASATCNGHALHKAKCIIAHSSEFIRNATGIFEL